MLTVFLEHLLGLCELSLYKFDFFSPTHSDGSHSIISTLHFLKIE